MNRVIQALMLALALGQFACASQLALAPPGLQARALEFPSPSPGRARVYVFRPGGHDRSLLPVAIDGVMLGSTMQNSFLMVELMPGSHIIASTTQENVSMVTLDAREGQVYFIKLSDRLGLATTRSALVQVDSMEGREAVTGSRMVQTISPSP
jgi:hypothetical protein